MELAKIVARNQERCDRRETEFGKRGEGLHEKENELKSKLSALSEDIEQVDDWCTLLILSS
jgi:hypothetical protein